MKKKITRKEIAEMAGVSVSVVSRAVNNSGYVKKEVKERILQIAEEYNYVPNPVAMSLQKSKVRQILFYCKDLHNAFNIDLYKGMMEEAKKRNYMVLINGSISFSELPTTMIDGIILQNEISSVEFDQVCGKNYYLPAVIAGYGDYYPWKRRIPIVEWDTHQGMELAIEYLQKKGHRRIAYAGPFPIDYKNARTIAWCNTMKPILGDKLKDYYFGICHQEILGIPKLEEYRADYADTRFEYEEEFFEKGIIAAKLLIKKKLNATAIICFNDEFAFGMIQELQRNHVSIPNDISLISFDGSYRRSYVYPELTCVTGNPKHQGELLAKMLIDIIEEKKEHNLIRIPSKILEGETVKDINHEG